MCFRLYFTENVGKTTIVELTDHHLENGLAIGNVHLGDSVGRKRWKILGDEVKFYDTIIGKVQVQILKFGFQSLSNFLRVHFVRQNFANFISIEKNEY